MRDRALLLALDRPHQFKAALREPGGPSRSPTTWKLPGQEIWRWWPTSHPRASVKWSTCFWSGLSPGRHPMVRVRRTTARSCPRRASADARHQAAIVDLVASGSSRRRNAPVSCGTAAIVLHAL